MEEPRPALGVPLRACFIQDPREAIGLVAQDMRWGHVAPVHHSRVVHVRLQPRIAITLERERFLGAI